MEQSTSPTPKDQTTAQQSAAGQADQSVLGFRDERGFFRWPQGEAAGLCRLHRPPPTRWPWAANTGQGPIIGARNAVTGPLP
jgi:hypothetical protein